DDRVARARGQARRAHPGRAREGGGRAGGCRGACAAGAIAGGGIAPAIKLELRKGPPSGGPTSLTRSRCGRRRYRQRSRLSFMLVVHWAISIAPQMVGAPNSTDVFQ